MDGACSGGGPCTCFVPISRRQGKRLHGATDALLLSSKKQLLNPLFLSVLRLDCRSQACIELLALLWNPALVTRGFHHHPTFWLPFLAQDPGLHHWQTGHQQPSRRRNTICRPRRPPIQLFYHPPHIITMRVSSAILLALPALTVAEEQIPLLDKVKGFFNKATAVVSSAIPAAPSAPLEDATEKVAAKVASVVQYPITLENWKEVITVDPTASPPTTQDWLIFATGGNSTCFGLCGNVTKAWNVCV